MRISDLQVAKNNTSFCLQLTQYKYTDHKVSTQLKKSSNGKKIDVKAV